MMQQYELWSFFQFSVATIFMFCRRKYVCVHLLSQVELSIFLWKNDREQKMFSSCLENAEKYDQLQESRSKERCCCLIFLAVESPWACLKLLCHGQEWVFREKTSQHPLEKTIPHSFQLQTPKQTVIIRKIRTPLDVQIQCISALDVQLKCISALEIFENYPS